MPSVRNEADAIAAPMSPGRQETSAIDARPPALSPVSAPGFAGRPG
jgi:hypothetical protein